MRYFCLGCVFALLVACTPAPPTPAPLATMAALTQVPTSQAAVPTTQPAAAATAAPATPTASSASTPTALATAQPAVPAVPAASVQPTVSVQPAPPLERTLALQSPALQGEDVRQAQQRLLDLGYNQVGAADGVFGPNTEAAVRTFQALNDLILDGILGPDTWSSLFDSAATVYDLHPIVDTQSSLLLGATNAGEWKNVATIGDVIGARGYRLLGQQAARDGVVAGSAPELPVAPCDYARVVSFEDVGGTPPAEGRSNIDPALPIALDGNWNVLPRPVAEVPTDTAALQAPIAETLRVLGLPDPQVRVTRALRADLDANGVEETIVAATYRVSGGAFPAPTAAAGDYSVLLTIPANSNRATVISADVITQAIEFGAPLEYSLIGIWDLNGDGRMELVAAGTYYEGESIGIYTLDGIATNQALLTGCGV